MQQPILPPRCEELIGPLLASLPAASISPRPPAALLPLLSPILRQRVQLLSESTQDPWLPLLCYDESKASKLATTVKNERFEPHPVSGEVEVDWDDEVVLRYKRLDEETLQGLITLQDLGLEVKLVYCLNDEAGGGSGWRIGEVLVSDPTNASWGQTSISDAESAFSTSSTRPTNGKSPAPKTEEDDEDDDYWAQYDNTPAQTPGPHETQEPNTRKVNGSNGAGAGDEDSYYAQYASVQPAMDNHDPDEARENGTVESSLGREEITSELRSHLASSQHDPELHSTSEAWSDDSSLAPRSRFLSGAGETEAFVAHPRPTSSQGSSGSDTVARLERAAAAERSSQETSETGIKQHIGTSIKSLWRLAKVVGMEREEFERIVQTELDCLGMMDEDSI